MSEKLGIPLETLQNYEESTTNSLLYSIYTLGKMSEATDNFLSKESQILLEEQHLIREYAMQGSAIFVGRCAASVLENRSVLKVFIHAEHQYRKQRAITDYGIPEKSADSVIANYDKKRSHFYSLNTGKKWNDWNNYEVILDSGKLGLEECVNIIRTAAV